MTFNSRRQFHIGAQNDALFILSGLAPATTNDYPNHEADRTCIAKVYDEGEARRLVEAANRGLSVQASVQPDPVAAQPVAQCKYPQCGCSVNLHTWAGCAASPQPAAPAQATDEITFTSSEIAAMQKSPDALNALADWHDYQQTMGEAMDPDVFAWSIKHHEVRRKQLRAEAERIQKENEA